MKSYLAELRNCELCEWRCRVDRLNGEKGVCMMGVPKAASTTLHPAPPKSYTIFMAGCSFRCLNCQNWTIAHHPEQDTPLRGFIEPRKLAEEAVEKIDSPRGKFLGADRIFFSGGSPTPSLPYIEEVVKEASKVEPGTKVNYDTNGFLTEGSLRRVIEFTDSITFDIKAFNDHTHRALTGAPVEPVLRNAEYIAENAKEKLWEFRYLLIPGINEREVDEVAGFLSSIDESIPLNLLAFRPNFVLENYNGASRESMERAVDRVKKAGLKNVSWSGRTGIVGERIKCSAEGYGPEGAKLAGGIAQEKGCITHPRSCGECRSVQECNIKRYEAKRRN